MILTLDEWVDKNAKQLKKDVEIHLKYGEDHVRLIMISIRQWFEEKEKMIEQLKICAKCYPFDEGVGCKNCIVKKERSR